MIAGTIEFADLGGPVYVGRANGLAARKQMKVGMFDDAEGVIRVRVPDSTYTVNSSFFLGMFGPSISHFGSTKSFFKHYEFDCPPHIYDGIRSAAERALASRGTLALSA